MNTRARNLRDDMTPHHQHDCDSCIYLGSSSEDSTWLTSKGQEWDFYFCDKGNGDGSLIARHGEYGDYYSTDLSMFRLRQRDQNDPLEMAYCHFLVASW